MGAASKDYNEFEDFAVNVFKKLFKNQDVEIVQTKYGSDGGKDGEGENKLSIGNFQDIQKYWVEAKQRNTSNLKLHDIGKTLILVFNKGVHSVYIVTNSNFDQQAIRESRNFSNKSDKKVFLVNGQELSRLAKQVSVKIPETINISEKTERTENNEIEIISSLYPNPNNNYTGNLTLLGNGIAYISVNINLDRTKIKNRTTTVKCVVNNRNIQICPEEYKIPKNAIGVVSKQFVILCDYNELKSVDLTLKVDVIAGDELIYNQEIKNAYSIKSPILPKINTISFTKYYNEILQDLNHWEKDFSVKNILIKAEAGVGKSFLINNIRQEILRREYNEILLYGESHKYPSEVVQSILRSFFPLPEESFSIEDINDIKYIISNSDLKIDSKIIDYISEFLCKSNKTIVNTELDIEFLAEVISSLLLRFSVINKKQIFIYEDLHKADVSVVFFLEEIQRLIRKKVKENRVFFLLTSRESRNIQDIKSSMLWIERFEALYSNDFIKTITLKAIEKDDAVKILNNLIPTLNEFLCEKIVQQGGSTPFFLKEYIGLMIQDNLICIDEDTLDSYSLVNPLELKSYIDEEKFITPTKERLITIFQRYEKNKIKDFLSLAASLGQQFNAIELLSLIDSSDIDVALSKCFELEVIRRSEYTPNYYLFDHDIIRYTILDNLNAFEHSKYAKQILNKLSINSSQRIKILYQSGDGNSCFQALKEELIKIENNPSLYYAVLQWKQLAINLVDHSFFKGILTEYKNLLLNDWDYVFYVAPVCSISLDYNKKIELLKELLLSTLRTLLEISSGSDNLTDRIISEGLMIAKQSSDNYSEALFRYHYGYLLMERNDVARSIDEHKKVIELLKNCEREDRDTSELLAENILRLAICHRKIGEFKESRKLLIEGLKLNQDKSRNYYIGFRGNFAATFYYTDPERHLRYYQRTLEIAEKQNLQHLIARTHLQLGISYFRFSNYEKANYEFQIAKEMFKTLESTNEQVRYNLNWGCYLLVVKKEFIQSEMILKEAEEIAIRQKNERRLWRIYANLATIYESSNKIKRAFEYDNLAINIILKGHDFNNDIVGKVVLHNRERCALINIFLRIILFPEYEKLSVRIKQVIGKKLFSILKKDAKLVIESKVSDLTLEMGSFFKEINNGIIRAIVME
ncbi:MAG: hypothetical protein GQ564_10690 [Bacteroidales bacterium]|nr:hypothetical protein [Bacteroidales bacterium]